MSLKVEQLLAMKIRWRETSQGHWHSMVEGVECSLTMNDFPDEPLYTVQCGSDPLDLDDPPADWWIEDVSDRSPC